MKPHAPWKMSTAARILALVLALILCGAPETARALAAPQTQNSAPAQNSQPQPNAPADQQQPAPANNPNSAMPNPAQPPLQPAPSLPEAPSATQRQQPSASPAQQQAPAGAAAAQAGQTAGGAASKPAGTAIAPAKQRQVRSLLIKVGAIAGAGIALGTVYALSRGTSSKPPGAK